MASDRILDTVPAASLDVSHLATTLTKHMFVLGIDPGLTRTGYAVIEVRGHRIGAVSAGVIRTDPQAALAQRLLELERDLTELVRAHNPAEAAIEEVFANRNLQTATKVARASGVILLVLAREGIEVAEYSPTAVKVALTGYGAADKEQMTRVVTMRLGLPAPPKPADAADALAIALCHAQGAGRRRALERAR